MANIFPSTNKQELLSQLYVFRGILGELYCELWEIKRAKQNKISAKENYAEAEQEITDTKEEIRKGMIIDRINKKLKPIRNISRVSTITLFIAISITLCVIFYLFTSTSFWPGLGISLFVLLPIAGFFFKSFSEYYEPAVRIDEKFYGEDSESIEYYNINDEGHSTKRIIISKEELAEYMKKNKSSSEVQHIISIKKSLPELKEQISQAESAEQAWRNSFYSKRDYVAQMFSNFLLQADWHMVDTLIYMVASGRANTMQEALNYGDLKLRHEETMNMLKSVKVTMEQGFIKISNGLNELTKTVNYLRGDVKEVGDGIYNLQKTVEFASLYLGSTMHIESKEIARTINGF